MNEVAKVENMSISKIMSIDFNSSEAVKAWNKRHPFNREIISNFLICLQNIRTDHVRSTHQAVQ
ncbi:MAG: hypothetical protein GY742_03630 [Hyphomicrobiales bacterium]|nr:hypothetical protein [Lentisphaerota bacterium]MCP4070815.1 hypothetical protein [Hyphomicrobiales bacterium]